MEKVFCAITVVIGIIVMIFMLGLVFSYPIMLLWNGCLVPAVAGINSITWLQACGLSILTSFLFKSSPTVVNDK
jgi:hypothetical protein